MNFLHRAWDVRDGLFWVIFLVHAFSFGCLAALPPFTFLVLEEEDFAFFLSPSDLLLLGPHCVFLAAALAVL